jgi:hypothetical protein
MCCAYSVCWVCAVCVGCVQCVLSWVIDLWFRKLCIIIIIIIIVKAGFYLMFPDFRREVLIGGGGGPRFWSYVLLSVRRTGFDHRSVHVRFFIDKLTLCQVFLSAFLFPLSVPFHQCSTLIFIYMLLLPEEQVGQAWELSKKQRCFGNRGATIVTLIIIIPSRETRTSKKTHRGNNHCQGVTHSPINSHQGFDTMWLTLLLLPLHSQSQCCNGTAVWHGTTGSRCTTVY